ncbi:hypothetical protein GGF46_002128 [Coemansia sp. RSA 552]|nr:hypothetical protein GGF46_002128 [Coemansia sp. RSA 552]
MHEIPHVLPRNDGMVTASSSITSSRSQESLRDQKSKSALLQPGRYHRRSMLFGLRNSKLTGVRVLSVQVAVERLILPNTPPSEGISFGSEDTVELAAAAPTRHDVSDVLVPSYLHGPSSQSIAKAADAVSADVECLMRKRQLRSGVKLPGETSQLAADAALLKEAGDGIADTCFLYESFASLVRLVGILLRAHIGNGGVERLVLPTNAVTFAPRDGLSNAQEAAALIMADAQADIECVNARTYANILCAVIARTRRDENQAALDELSACLDCIYQRQYNRRHAWGLAICGAHIYICWKLNDSTVVSPVLDMAIQEDRKALVRLLVDWSLCPLEHLGFDPEVRVSDSYCQRMARGNVSLADDIPYETAFRDSRSGWTVNCVTTQTISTPSSFLGSRPCVCVHQVEVPDSLGGGHRLVLIKDVWPLAQTPPGPDPQGEIATLDQIHQQLGQKEPAYLYPKVIGHECAAQHDATDTASRLRDLELQSSPGHAGDPHAWKHQSLREHHRIMMEPAGDHLQTVACEEELVIVLADAMRFHRAVYEECGILHGDLSVDNIVVVRQASQAAPRGMLINFEHAVRVNSAEPTVPSAHARPALFRSIADLLGLGVRHTILDDWESLICVIDWQASVGIRPDDHVAKEKIVRYPILEWLEGSVEEIAQAKRRYMNSTGSFKTATISRFQHKYPLLANLAAELHVALFEYKDCPGALAPVKLVSVDGLNTGVFPRRNEPKEDPLLKRVRFEKDIVARLWKVMNAVEKVAKERLDKM